MLNRPVFYIVVCRGVSQIARKYLDFTKNLSYTHFINRMWGVVMLDFIFDFIIEFVLEGTMEGITYLITKIIPEYKIHPRFEQVLKVFIAILSAIITCMLIFGIVIRILADTYEDKKLANTLLTISGTFVAILVLIRIFTPKKQK